MALIVKPLSIPDAGAQEYAHGDVAHLTQTDELAYPAISSATRQLAYRDVLISDKLNEVIGAINNREQLITLPTVRTTLPASSTETVANFRIPDGYEARIINAKVFSTSSDATLKVLYNESYGQTTGQEIVSTMSEVNAGTSFYGVGEFVVNLTSSTIATDVVASVIISLRPLGVQAGGLISAGTVGQTGPRGLTGARGATGNNGTNGISFIWRGLHDITQAYSANDVVRKAFGGIYSCFIAKVSIAANSGFYPPDPSVTASTTQWDLFVGAGVTQGPQGIPGTAGTPGANGANGTSINPCGRWNPGLTYYKCDLVTILQDVINRTFVVFSASAPAGLSPIDDAGTTGVGTYWMELFGPSYTGVAVTGDTVSAYYLTAGYTTTTAQGSTSGGYLALTRNASTETTGFCKESLVYSTDDASGFAVLIGGASLLGKDNVNNTAFTITLSLPKPGAGSKPSKATWTTDDVKCLAIAANNTAGILSISAAPNASKDAFIITVDTGTAAEQKFNVSLFGAKPF